MQLTGYISQIIGPVIDVHFPDLGEDRRLPGIHEAMTAARPDGKEQILEVQQHIGENTVRAIAMESTDGLQRHLPVTAAGRSISMPVGDQIKGRLLNVVGESIDGLCSLDRTEELPIHRGARPSSSWNLSTTSPRATTASRSSPVWASVPARVTTCSAR